MGDAGDECGEALHELYVFLDGELTPERRRAIQHHLDDCPPCYQKFDFEDELRKVISERCREQVPEELRRRILQAIERLQVGPQQVTLKGPGMGISPFRVE